MLKEISVFDHDECERIIKTVHNLRNFWTRRAKREGLPFYTLGAASYLDAQDYDSYLEQAAKTNLVLSGYFKWMYAKVLEKLEEALDKPVTLTDRYALPGFHIFQGSKVFEKPVASLHCDLQYDLLDWSGHDINPDSVMSFTVAVELPSSGGGLMVWDLTYQDTEGATQDEKNRLIRDAKSHYHEYKEGGMVLHSGHLWHQIAPFIDAKPADERITLQGHGVICDDKYHFYW